MAASVPIRTRDLTRYYGSTVGVEGLTLDVERGEVFGFLGPNGAGKTTTIRLLLDLIRPSRGEAFLFGRSSRDPSLRAGIGYLPGELALDGRMSGASTLSFLAALQGAPDRETTTRRRHDVCARLGLTPGDLGRKVREYSRGMKQKLALVAAFQHAPELLILDEPTTGLDPLVREEVFQLMAEARDAGATVFHCSHVLSEADRSCDRVGVLREGRLVALLTMEEARRAATRTLVVEFRAEPPMEELQSAGLVPVGRDGRRLILKVVGEMPEVLGVLARHPVRHLSFPEPRLQDAFRALYGGRDATS
jgi:ABC-2 type transport system ATP-binding protein